VTCECFAFEGKVGRERCVSALLSKGKLVETRERCVSALLLMLLKGKLIEIDV
jgi:hypothetical protein